MANIRKKHSPEFKLRAVLEIIKGDKTATQLGGELGVHPMMLSNWKKHFLEHGPEIFERVRGAYAKANIKSKKRSCLSR